MPDFETSLLELPTAGSAASRVRTDGKHLIQGRSPFALKGFTYGSFRRRKDGARFPDETTLRADCRAMAAAGVNTVRVYTTPPADLLDAAEAHGLNLIIGLDYHDWRMEAATDRAARRRITEAGRHEVDRALEVCSGHSSVLAIAVGNEVPADLVRLHGAAHVAETLSELVERVHRADDDLLATYVNFPTTEFLEVEGQDFISFNVFLEDSGALKRYLRHLQIVAGNKPLVLTELGLAADVHGEQAQAESIAWQLGLAAETGCAGACVFSWTDEWAVDDTPVEGWGFGLTTTLRHPKPALEAFASWASSSLSELRANWPKLSVVVCAHNEEATIRECLTSLLETDYPALEVIVCVDGSTDRTYELAAEFPFRVLQLPHGGLSRARNRGLAACTGEIVAYLDADAACHPHWPYHLALSLEDDGAVATGGPNLPFPEAGLVERAVALSPGDPVEVLLGDDRAEHIPGCNMAFRVEALAAIGGFNVACTAAGDDVDVCWRLLDRQQQIAFAPAAQVRHHRRSSIERYFKQQIGYGRAEKMLSGAHPHRFNGLGQARWTGFVYTKARLLPSLLAPVVYYGYQGTAPFQSVTSRPAQAAIGWVGARLPILAPLAVAGTVLAFTSPAWLALPVASLLIALIYGVAVCRGLAPERRKGLDLRVRALAGLLHVAQPFARLWGRLRGGRLPASDRQAAWQGNRHQWLRELKRQCETSGLRVDVGGPIESWDLQVRRGVFAAARITTAVVWDWEPRYRVRWLPRPAAAAWLIATAVTLLVGPVEAGAVLAAGVCLALLELAGLRRRLSPAIVASTSGASDHQASCGEGTGGHQAESFAPRPASEGLRPLVFDTRVFSSRDGIPAPQPTTLTRSRRG